MKKIEVKERLEKLAARIIALDNENIECFARALKEIAGALDNPMAGKYLNFVHDQWWWYRESNYNKETDEINDEMLEIVHLL